MKKHKILLLLLCISLITGCSHEHDWYYSSSKTIYSDYKVYACRDCEETSLGSLLSKDDENLKDNSEDEFEDKKYSEDELDEGDSTNITVYITDSGTKYHSSGCQYLSSSKHSFSLEDAINDGYSPCSRCNPPE